MAPPEQLNIAEDAGEKKHPFFCSVRMTYVICGFIGMVVHHSLRSALSISILCMVAEPVKPLFIQESSTSTKGCRATLAGNETHHGHGKHLGDLPWNRDQELLFPSVFFYGYVGSLPIAGYLCDKYGGKALFISSIMLEGAIFLLIPVCARANFWLAVAVRVLQGLIASLGNPAMYGLYTVWSHPSERSASIAFGFAGFNVGNMIIYPIVGWLCQFGWEYIFYILGGTVFSIGFIMNWLVYNNVDDHPRISPEEYRYLKPSQTNYNKKHATPWKSIATCVPIYAFVFTHFCQCFGSAMQALMLVRYFKEAMGFSIKEAGFLTSALFGGSSLSIIFAIIMVAMVEKRPSINLDLFHRFLQLACCWLAIPFVVVLTFLTCEDRWIAFAIWFCVFCIADFAFSAGYWPTISFLSPSYSGLLIGIANSVGTTTSVLVPFTITQLVPNGTASEWEHVIALLIITYFVGGLTFAVFGSAKLQPWGLRKDEEDAKI